MGPGVRSGLSVRGAAGTWRLSYIDLEIAFLAFFLEWPPGSSIVCSCLVPGDV